MAERHQGQQRSSGTLGKHRELISPGYFRLELGLIPWNSWKSFLSQFRRKPITPAPWILSQSQPYHIQFPPTHQLKRVRSHLFPTAADHPVRHLKSAVGTFGQIVCIAAALVNSSLLQSPCSGVVRCYTFPICSLQTFLRSNYNFLRGSTL
jgi:hypothetical protein